MNEPDRHWIAGYLEGEAYFGFCNIDVSTSDTDPLMKLQKLLGGKVTTRKIHPSRFGTKQMYRWVLGRRLGSLSVMQEILPLMSQRRKNQIKKVIQYAKTRPERNYETHDTKLVRCMYEQFRRAAGFYSKTL